MASGIEDSSMRLPKGERFQILSLPGHGEESGCTGFAPVQSYKTLCIGKIHWNLVFPSRLNAGTYFLPPLYEVSKLSSLLGHGRIREMQQFHKIGMLSNILCSEDVFPVTYIHGPWRRHPAHLGPCIWVVALPFVGAKCSQSIDWQRCQSVSSPENIFVRKQINKRE